MTKRGEVQAAAARDLIGVSFAHRTPPSVLTDSKQLSDSEYEEVMSFQGVHWQDVTFIHIEKWADAVFWFAPKAFYYYLPGILTAGLREHRWDTNAYDSLIGYLDRRPEPDDWDDFFLPRWPLLRLTNLTPLPPGCGGWKSSNRTDSSAIRMPRVSET